MKSIEIEIGDIFVIAFLLLPLAWQHLTHVCKTWK